MIEKIELKQIPRQELNMIFFWGVLCGYCWTRPGGPVCFLAGKQDKLTVEEKADVLEHVQSTIGHIRETRQTRKAFDELRRRGDSAGAGPHNKKSELP